MAGTSAYNAANILNWNLGGGSPTQPAAWAVGVATAAPTSVSPFELGTGTGLSRQSMPTPAAVSPAGSKSNSSAMTFGPANAGVTISGVGVFDQVASGGNYLYYGTLATARTLASGDSLVIAAGSLVVSLA